MVDGNDDDSDVELSFACDCLNNVSELLQGCDVQAEAVRVLVSLFRVELVCPDISNIRHWLGPDAGVRKMLVFWLDDDARTGGT